MDRFAFSRGEDLELEVSPSMVMVAWWINAHD
jgi:hypothetical protein